jgi:DNA-binding NarL/FixJ family response regulator
VTNLSPNIHPVCAVCNFFFHDGLMTMNNTIRLLVVDDFDSFRQWICLRRKTHSRFFIGGEAANAQEAIQKARELIPDLVLLDLSLPDANGLDVQQELHRAVPSTKVLFLSGWGDENIVRRALDNGAGGYLLKADAYQELVLAMESVVLGTRFVSSGLKTTRNTAQSFRYRLADAT